ncbi:hypothetical protein MA16_Dca003764 [Dendrobium catenatum]|uniref:Uncharacterized protein n=1 Tax=Dendrobium catenatum TaxID=906689 RepID=A0A2I0WFY8_9ASPA|nr:hypothetical protein MA16_Dca003764 [Dendrobium catenatum]
MLADKRFTAWLQSEYDSHDPIFKVARMIHVIPDLKQNMLLLENQIPILLLTIMVVIDGSGVTF